MRDDWTGEMMTKSVECFSDLATAIFAAIYLELPKALFFGADISGLLIMIDWKR